MRLLIYVALMSLATHALANNVIEGNQGSKIKGSVVERFQNPWAMSFISPDRLLVTTKSGDLWLVHTSGKKSRVTGVPKVFYGGQGGLGDVVPHPNFKQNKFIYISYISSDTAGDTRYATVVRAELNIENSPKLENITTVWNQTPARPGKGHFSHKITLGQQGSKHDGKIFITSGDRQEQAPAQHWDKALGKIIRLNDDGSVPVDNPFQDKGELAKTFWSIGHRNSLGIAFNQNGELWAHEMGPQHGDELNQIIKGGNYGWPLVSEGNHYNGTVIPNHDTRPDMIAPALAWVPTIAPSGLIFYGGDLFPEWRGNAFIGGLRSQALIRVDFVNGHPVEAERFRWSMRLREIEEGPDGALYVLEDGAPARLIRLVP